MTSSSVGRKSDPIWGMTSWMYCRFELCQGSQRHFFIPDPDLVILAQKTLYELNKRALSKIVGAGFKAGDQEH